MFISKIARSREEGRREQPPSLAGRRSCFEQRITSS
jgi:hypothetical protein